MKEFLFEMSDDPFEVSLRDNYELLVDEYGESLKRRAMLENKVTNMITYSTIRIRAILNLFGCS